MAKGLISIVPPTKEESSMKNHPPLESRKGLGAREVKRV
jgi:hypothetical protein